MDTIRNTDVRVPSGFEVEPARWKDRALDKVSSMRDVMSDRIASIKPKVDSAVATIRPKINDLRRNPAVIGGLAAAAGLSLGLVGRWMRHRAHAPMLLIVEV